MWKNLNKAQLRSTIVVLDSWISLQCKMDRSIFRFCFCSFAFYSSEHFIIAFFERARDRWSDWKKRASIRLNSIRCGFVAECLTQMHIFIFDGPINYQFYLVWLQSIYNTTRGNLLLWLNRKWYEQKRKLLN